MQYMHVPRRASKLLRVYNMYNNRYTYIEVQTASPSRPNPPNRRDQSMRNSTLTENDVYDGLTMLRPNESSQFYLITRWATHSPLVRHSSFERLQ